MKLDFPLLAIEKLRYAAFSLNCALFLFCYFFHFQFMLR